MLKMILIKVCIRRSIQIWKIRHFIRLTMVRLSTIQCICRRFHLPSTTLNKTHTRYKQAFKCLGRPTPIPLSTQGRLVARSTFHLNKLCFLSIVSQWNRLPTKVLQCRRRSTTDPHLRFMQLQWNIRQATSLPENPLPFRPPLQRSPIFLLTILHLTIITSITRKTAANLIPILKPWRILIPHQMIRFRHMVPATPKCSLQPSTPRSIRSIVDLQPRTEYICSLNTP